MTVAVDDAWTIPDALLRAEAEHPLEVLYICVPFAADVDARAGADEHATLMDAIAQMLIGMLGVRSHDYGIRRWPVDDFIAWRRRTEGDVEPAALQEFLIDVAGRMLANPAEASSLTVAAAPCDLRTKDRGRAFARAVTAAQRAASDPEAHALQCSASLLDLAIERRAFSFYHQPIVDVEHGSLYGYESLCRGTMDGMRFPDLIFGVAERTHRVWQVGRVLRDHIAAELEATTDIGLQFVNIHPSDLDDPAFAEQAVRGNLIPHAHRIVFELTERAAIRDYPRVKRVFRALRERGYQLAIDDLGSGYAGLTALAELEPDYVKFDMGLTRNLHEHPVKQQLLARMQQFATDIGARTISEGIESEHERDAVRSTGCMLMQGYFFGRPSPGYASVSAERYGRAPLTCIGDVG